MARLGAWEDGGGVIEDDGGGGDTYLSRPRPYWFKRWSASKELVGDERLSWGGPSSSCKGDSMIACYAVDNRIDLMVIMIVFTAVPVEDWVALGV